MARVHTTTKPFVVTQLHVTPPGISWAALYNRLKSADHQLCSTNTLGPQVPRSCPHKRKLIMGPLLFL